MVTRTARGATFRSRVTRAVAAAAVLSAAFSGACSVLLADGLTRAREDARLSGAANVFLAEVRARPGVALGAVADDEDQEISAEHMHLALDRDGARLGGSPELPHEAQAGCRTLGRNGRSLRVCAVASSSGRVIVASDLAPTQRARGAMALAALWSTLVAAAGALVASRRVSREIVAPLEALGAVVARVDPDAPMARSLSGPAGYEELDALRAVLAELLARLDRSMAQSRRFAADAAHELRTPLGAMRAELELTLEDDDPKALRAACVRLEKRLGAMGALAERLLILASPLESVSTEAVLMADVVEESVRRLTEAQRARVALSLDGDAYVRADATLLGVAVDNALSNALKFGANGPISVSVARDGERVVTRVRDAGPGVPEAERSRVFEAFYRSASSRAQGVSGSGVGLALVAHVLRAHGGEARFEDAREGAVLAMSLPRWS